MCTRDGIDKVAAKQRLESQLSEESYIKNSNYVIANNNTDLEKEAEEFLKLLNNEGVFNNETVIIKNGDIKYMQFKKLLEYEHIIKHVFTLKPFDFGSNKTYAGKQKEISANYKQVCNLLNLDYKNIVRPYQTHTNNVKAVNNKLRNI